MSDFIRSDDGLPEVNLAELAAQYGFRVPQPTVRLLRHRRDMQSGLVLEVGQRVPDYYGRRAAVVIAILGNEHVFCVVSRRPDANQDEDPIYVGKTAVEHAE